LKPVRLERDYELFVAVCQSYEDLTYINAIRNWKDRCQTSVCWIDEIWAASLPKYRHWLTALKQFDYVCIGYHGTVDPLSTAIGSQCHWVPGAVDAIRFNPDEATAPRVIDVYSMGRRWSGVHDALQRLAADREIFYVHDTFAAAHAEAYDHVQHRTLLANMAKRSRCFMVAPAKMDAPGETRGQVEIGYRYYEGAASGAVMIGRRPDCRPFEGMFGWPDAVVDIATDGSDVAEIVRNLRANPERLRAISRQNVAQSVVRHDWLHRWQRIFEIAGIQQSAGMARRDERLQELSRRAARDAAPAPMAFKRHFI
jgi:acyl carrier protein phosphodiesterase